MVTGYPSKRTICALWTNLPPLFPNGPGPLPHMGEEAHVSIDALATTSPRREHAGHPVFQHPGHPVYLAPTPARLVTIGRAVRRWTAVVGVALTCTPFVVTALGLALGS